MVFSDTSNLNGVIEDITFRTNASTTDFPLKTRTMYVNEAYGRVANIIIRADGRMQWDDTNHTDQPIYDCDLVSGQTDYNVFSEAPSALQDWLTIERVEGLDEAGNGVLLRPIDKRDIPESMAEYRKTAGQIDEYDFNGTNLLLYPAPNYSKTNGLTIYFHRAPSYFVSTDTTKRPGFASIFHPYLSIYASYVWNSVKKNDWSLKPILDQMEKEIGEFYSRRPKYEVPRISRGVSSSYK